LAVGRAQLFALAEGTAGADGYISIRAEDVILSKGNEGASSVRNRLAGQVRMVTPEGPMVRISVECGFSLTALVTKPAYQELQFQEGDPVTVWIKALAIHFIPHE
jgi:molybdate transport system ATP-binding protein